MQFTKISQSLWDLFLWLNDSEYIFSKKLQQYFTEYSEKDFTLLNKYLWLSNFDLQISIKIAKIKSTNNSSLKIYSLKFNRFRSSSFKIWLFFKFLIPLRLLVGGLFKMGARCNKGLFRCNLGKFFPKLGKWPSPTVKHKRVLSLKQAPRVLIWQNVVFIYK